MINKVILPILAYLLVVIKCSRVIDLQSQEALYAADYCKSIGVCPEGSHVLCTHYVPNKTHGPLCVETHEIFIAPEYAELILDLLNLIRGRSAEGKTVGMANLTLPRAYGLYRLEWDPELSTLAQVWASTCIIGADMCRATKRFSDPAQMAGLTRFNEDWMPINAKGLFNYTGLSIEKVKYGIHSMLRSWYRTKQYVHPEDITETNDVWPRHLGSNIFLMIVHGRVTHVGCGLSLFREYSYDRSTEHKTRLTHNVVRLVCNLSSRLRATPGKNRVYNTDPPTQERYTVKCGCPLGYDEDEYCLCYETGRKIPFSCKSKECKPPVVVLPIFTVENAQPSKLNGELRKAYISTKSTNEVNVDHLNDMRSRSHDLRGSMFLKLEELPSRKLKIERTENKLLKNNEHVKKKYSNLRNLESRYLIKRRSMKITEPQRKDDIKNISTNSHQNDYYNDNDFNNSIKENMPLQKGNTKNSLIKLLNELEEEANKVQLVCDRKNFLDQKIRNIYNIFVEKVYPSPNDKNINKIASKNVTFDSSPIYGNEKQFNIIKQKDFDKINKNSPTLNNEVSKETNTNSMKVDLMDPNFKDNSFSHYNDEIIGITNIQGLRSSNNSKSEKYFQIETPYKRQEDDLLNLEKRQFYQDRLNYLKRKLQDFQNYGSQNKMHAARQMRVLPTYHELQLRRKMPDINRF